jgi:hypothetical protein
MPIVAAGALLAAVDLGILIYWCYWRAPRKARAGRIPPRTPMRSLADVIQAAGLVLIVTALWLTILGFLTEFGITSETTAHWSDLAAIGFQVTAGQPSAFGARCLVVAAAVWVVGFGLGKGTGPSRDR